MSKLVSFWANIVENGLFLVVPQCYNRLSAVNWLKSQEKESYITCRKYEEAKTHIFRNPEYNTAANRYFS